MKRSHVEWQATPPWANLRAVYAFYNTAAQLREFGVPAAVDHIYPLQGEDFCGLHVETNLQRVNVQVNSGKSNQPIMVETLTFSSPQLVLF